MKTINRLQQLIDAENVSVTASDLLELMYIVYFNGALTDHQIGKRIINGMNNCLDDAAAKRVVNAVIGAIKAGRLIHEDKHGCNS